MDFIQRDPLTNDGARVTNTGQSYVFAVTEVEEEAQLVEGKSFNCNSGFISLTSASESAVFYLKNTGTTPLIITQFVVGAGASTGGTGDAKLFIERNPTGGTIVSGASAADITPTSSSSNKNFASSNTFSVDAYKGAEGNTLTGADGDSLLGFASYGTSVRNVIPYFIRLDTGNSVGVIFDPPASNTSMEVYVAVAGYLQTEPFS
jgi:hypothetical protein